MGGDTICSKICQTELQLSANASDEEYQSMAGNLVNFFKCSKVYVWVSEVKISNQFSSDFVKNKVWHNLHLIKQQYNVSLDIKVAIC